MTQSSNNSSKLKISVIIIIVVSLAASVGLFFYISNNIQKGFQANEVNTFALPQSVKNIVTNRDSIAKIEDQIPTNQPVNFSKYVYLREGLRTSKSGEMSFYEFDTQMNKKLNTLENVSSPDIDGMILYRLQTETVGHYGKDDAPSNIVSTIAGDKTEEEINVPKAMKFCVVLLYVSVPDGVVLKRDSIWGTEPPSRIKRSENGGLGSLPDDDEIIKTIQSTIR